MVRTLQCLVKGEALVSLCPGHAAVAVTVQALIVTHRLHTTGILKYGPREPGFDYRRS